MASCLESRLLEDVMMFSGDRTIFSGRSRALRRSAAFLLALSLLGLSGCDSSDDSFVASQNAAAGGPGRVNTLRVVDPTPDAAFGAQSQPVRLVTAKGYDAPGKVVFGPQEEVYDEEMIFSGLPDQTVRVELEYQRGQGFTLATFADEVDFRNDDDGIISFQEVVPTAVAASRNTFTVRLANNSGYPDDQVFVTVYGKNAAKTGFFYLKFNGGESASSTPMGPLAGWADYSQQLSLLQKEGEHTYTFQCPIENLVSGRIYLSLGKKLQGLGLNDVNNPLSLQQPSATGLPDSQTLYEFTELSATSQPAAPLDYTLYCNTSVVDFFSIGLGMRLDYSNGGQNVSQSVGFVDGARDLVLAEFEKGSTPSEFRNYVRKDGSNTILRVLSPVQKIALEPDGALAHFLDSAIDSAWTHYAQVVLNIPDTIASHAYGYQWTGQLISNALLAMTCTQKAAGDSAGGDLESLGEVCHLAKPTSRIVFFCDDNQSPPLSVPDRDTYRDAGSDGHKRLVSLIGAALNRGVFETYDDWGSAEKFYTRADGKFNWYAKIMHQYALDGKVYGFGYDDVYGQDPTLSRAMPDVNQVVVTIPAVPR
jgi:hypothetical protein